MKKALELYGLSFSYANTKILEDLSMTLYEGEFAAIIGANGSGKSTLLKLIFGELALSKGSIKFFDKEKLDKNDFGKIAYIPQQGLGKNSNFPASSFEVVSTNLYGGPWKFGIFNKEKKEKVYEALKLVGMEDFSDRPIGKLSGGQRQRVLLARALISKPSLIVLDEATAGVDQESSNEFYKILRKLSAEDKVTILAVTHDLGGIFPYIDRTFCLEKANLIELSKEEVQNELSHRHRHPRKGEKVNA